MNIPDKIYFRIGEVSKIVGVETYTLRYWETEFEHLAKVKKINGQRMYTKKDIENFLEIKDLLYKDKFTIQGAKKYLKTSKKDKILKIKKSLKELRDVLHQI